MTIESKGIYRFSSSYTTFQKCINLSKVIEDGEPLKGNICKSLERV